MNTQTRTLERGFTLLEILISVGILATVGTLISQVLFTTTHVNTKSVIAQDIKQTGEFAIDVMSRQIRGAATVETPCDFMASQSNSLVIHTLDDLTSTYICQSDGIAARLASVAAGGAVTYLTNNNVTLSASGGVACDDSTLTFSCISGNGITEPVIIQFTLRQLGATLSAFTAASHTFESTVKIRN